MVQGHSLSGGLAGAWGEQEGFEGNWDVGESRKWS